METNEPTNNTPEPKPTFWKKAQAKVKAVAANPYVQFMVGYVAMAAVASAAAVLATAGAEMVVEKIRGTNTQPALEESGEVVDVEVVETTTPEIINE